MQAGMLGFPGPFIGKPGTGLDVFSSGSGAWSIPNGVRRFYVVAIGGGGGGGDATGIGSVASTDGGATSVEYCGLTLVAEGGNGAQSGLTGGGASGAQLNSSGQSGQLFDSSTPAHTSISGGTALLGLAYGRGGDGLLSYASGGGGGGCLQMFERQPNVNEVIYSIGTAGTAAEKLGTAYGTDGGSGVVMFIYETPAHTS